jgi:hypothetical protein
MSKRMWNLALVCMSTASACAGEVSETPDVDALASSASGFQRMEPCPTESSYVPRAVVRSGVDASFYSPQCARLASGGTVVFSGRFAEHPLEPRPVGTVSSPIVLTRDGGSVEFEFPDPGFYPYGCAVHPEEIGVIWASAGF